MKPVQVVGTTTITDSHGTIKSVCSYRDEMFVLNRFNYFFVKLI